MSSTQDELKAALELARQVAEWPETNDGGDRRHARKLREVLPALIAERAELLLALRRSYEVGFSHGQESTTGGTRWFGTEIQRRFCS